MDLIYGVLPAALPDWARVALAGGLCAVALITFMALGPLLYVYVETKIAGFMQDRIGPKRVGPHGMLQTIADGIKLIFKEAIYPAGADKKLFILAPCLVVVGAFLSFVVLPFSSRLQAVDLDVGVFYVVAVSSISTVGIIMAGWASNNKYALFGAMRSAAQIVSYEIPAVMSLLAVVVMVGSLSLQQIVLAQAGGLHQWFLFKYFPLMPVAAVVLFVAGLAECNRTPFDIPEAESELVAGFHTEYSGFFFAMFFLAEYTEMFVVSALTAVLFLGGWWAPLPALQQIGPVGLGGVWLIAKAWFLVFVMMWLRWTLPRLRVDQLMYMAWKVLLPIAMALLVIVGGLVMLPATRGGWTGLMRQAGLPAPLVQGIAVAGPWLLTVGLFGYLAFGILSAVRWSAQRTRELAA